MRDCFVSAAVPFRSDCLFPWPLFHGSIQSGHEPLNSVIYMEGVREVVRNLLTKQTLSPEERDILYPPSEPPKKKRSPRRPPNRGRVGKPQKEYEIINLPEEEPDDRDGYEIINRSNLQLIYHVVMLYERALDTSPPGYSTTMI